MFGYLKSVWEYLLSTPPKPQTLTENPWREPSDWNKKLEKELIQQIEKLQPQNLQLPKPQRKETNLLIQGPVSAGKSSFINSVLSIKKDMRTTVAVAGSCSNSSTKYLAEYSDEDLLRGYRIFDCMGLEPNDKKGFNIDDLEFIIRGHIKTGYMFNEANPIKTSSDKYRQHPNFWDRIQCVIFVASAATIQAGLNAAYVDKIKGLQETLREQDISSVLILTKVDELCDEVDRDIKKLFWSIKVRDAVQTASSLFGIESASIYPVKNYVHNLKICTEMNIPLLLALNGAMNVAAANVGLYKKRLQKNNDEDENN